MSLTFAQGFFLGQLSVVLLLGAFIKFFIFGEAPATIAQYRQTAYNLRDGGDDGPPSVLTSLEAAINDPAKRPSFVDEIKITEISMGEEYPIFSNVRVVSVDEDASSSSAASSSAATGGRLQALVDVDLSDDNLTLAIETSLVLNYPKPFSAILPVALSVSVVRFSGTLSISFVPATEEPTHPNEPPSGKPKTNLAFSFLPDYRLDLSVRSLIGSRSRLQDIPKIAQLVEARVQAWFEDRVVEPRVQVAPLPGLWPRMGKTRMREGKDDDQGRRPSERRRSENMPSQQDTDQLFEGLRMRAGPFKQRSDSQVIIGDDDIRLPGALST
ncbi:hypothetical protein DV738_g1545, partial [Chaetothyriales sp. CBS 135597]